MCLLSKCIASPVSGSSSFELVPQKMQTKKTAMMSGTTTKGEEMFTRQPPDIRLSEPLGARESR